MVEERAVLADLRHQRASCSSTARIAQGDRRNRDLLHADLKVYGRRERRRVRGALSGEMDVSDDPTDNDNDGEYYCNSGGILEDDIQREGGLE